MMREVCGARCDRDDHDPGDEWICTLPPDHPRLGFDYHAAIVIGGWHQWHLDAHETETNPAEPARTGADWTDVIANPLPPEPPVGTKLARLNDPDRETLWWRVEDGWLCAGGRGIPTHWGHVCARAVGLLIVLGPGAPAGVLATDRPA